MARIDSPRIAVLGAGPIGLEVALYAVSLDLPVTVYEREAVGAHLRQWGHIRLFSPSGMNRTSLGVAALRADDPQHALPDDRETVTGRDHLASYLEPLAGSSKLDGRVHLGVQVLGVGRRAFFKGDLPGDARRAKQPFVLLLRERDGRERLEEADVVIDCTGTYGKHRWLGEGGLPAPGEHACARFISYGLEDVLGDKRGTYAGRTVLVVGGGYSAATSVCNLAALAEQESATWVVWLARGSGTQPIRRVMSDPLPERDRLAMKANNLATRADGNVEFHKDTAIEALEPMDHGVRVRARASGREATWEVEQIIANVGYSPDTALYQELQVHECYATEGPMALAAALAKSGGDCLTIPPPGAQTLRNPEPNFYVLGSKSYGRNSHFLLRNGFEQVREVFTLITGKAVLNLYRKQ